MNDWVSSHVSIACVKIIACLAHNIMCTPLLHSIMALQGTMLPWPLTRVGE